MNVLDLGAGEGYVGKEVQRRWEADVMLVDVVPLNQTGLPFKEYDGQHLSFPDKHFDTTILYFVLHHCQKPEQVFREVLRVTKGDVLVAESVL